MESEQKGLSKVTHEGRWVIDKNLGLYIECYVTNDRRRLLSLKGAGRTLELKGAGSTALSRNLQRDWIHPYLTDELQIWIRKVEERGLEQIVTKSGRHIVPLDAELFVDICNAYVSAQKDGLFTDNKGRVIPKWTRQYYTADKLLRLMSAFAKIGIIGLIDEITGYQEVRDKAALQALLDKFLLPDYAKWAKRFPDEFYILMFKLKGWQWKGMKVNRPSIVGKYTNDLVYERLAPGILEELRQRNPPDEHGRRKAKHQQWLTEDIGHPALQRHLTMLIGFERASSNWGMFYRMVQRALPKMKEQMPLPFEE
jgi:hypothetical protein